MAIISDAGFRRLGKQANTGITYCLLRRSWTIQKTHQTNAETVSLLKDTILILGSQQYFFFFLIYLRILCLLGYGSWLL